MSWGTFGVALGGLVGPQRPPKDAQSGLFVSFLNIAPTGIMPSSILVDFRVKVAGIRI